VDRTHALRVSKRRERDTSELEGHGGINKIRNTEECERGRVLVVDQSGRRASRSRPQYSFAPP